MQLKQDFLIDRPVDEVWSFFHDIPALAECLPGAEYLGPTEDGKHSGKLTSKIGPFQASFAGEANVAYDEDARTISLDGKGETCRFSGRVVDLDGQPIADARLDVWSDNAEGFYDVQQPGVQPKWNNRGIFTTGPDGAYDFVGIKPVSYPVPVDGPAGEMLTGMGRHPYRPAHTHLIVTAPGFQKLVTHIFVGEDPYIDSDAVFGVKESLMAPFQPLADGDTAWLCPFDIVLAPESA